MKKKMLSALMCVSVMAATLAGCGSTGDSAPATEAPAEDAAEAPADGTAEAPAEDAAEAPAAESTGDGLVYWSM